MLSFLRIFKFNVFKFNKKLNVLDLKNCTSVLPKSEYLQKENTRLETKLLNDNT